MSIQEAREKIAANSAALVKADAAFADNTATRYNAIKAKGGHPADYRRMQGDVRAWLSSHLEKPGAFTAEANAARLAAEGWTELLQSEIDLTVFAAAGFPAASAKASGWIDANTGKPVRVVASADKISTTSQNGPGVGDLVAGLISGAKTAEIKAALSEGTDSAGGFSIPTTVLPEFIDRLRAATRFIEAGAQTIMLDGLRTRIMRIENDPTAGWRAENAAVTESDPTFGAVDFVPKSLAVLVKVSVELLQDSVNVGAALEQAMIGALSVELDRACLFGSGTGNQPTGLFTVAGNTVSLGANGAALTNYDPWLDAIFELENDNVQEATASIMHPRTARSLAKLKDTTNQPLMLPPSLQILPMLKSTSIPVAQTQGTSSDASTAFLGDFRMAMLGMRQELVIQRLDQTFAGNLQVGFIASLRADVGFAQPNAFARIIGIRP
jgi:HK97 family phage major capsid protein